MLKAFDERESKGRRQKEKETSNRPFLIDFNKILKSKAFRRLSDKTQAFSIPEHAHIRTRIVHTNEVIANAIKISECLGLNTDLCMAIAAGHDIGHVPYGHLGEKILTILGKKPFHHATYSVVLAQKIENRGRGLNLTYETLKGMLMHARGKDHLHIDRSQPSEYGVVMYADKIAYTFADYSDANRIGYFPRKKHAVLIKKINHVLGKESKHRIDACITALIKESKAKGEISFSQGPEFQIFNELRDVLYNEVYPSVDGGLHEMTIKKLFNFISKNPEFKQKYNNFNPILFITLLTDREVTNFGHRMFSSKKISLNDIEHFGAFELLPELKDKKIDYSEPGLAWDEM